MIILRNNIIKNRKECMGYVLVEMEKWGQSCTYENDETDKHTRPKNTLKTLSLLLISYYQCSSIFMIQTLDNYHYADS